MKKKFYLFLIIFVCIFTIILIYKNKDNKLNDKLVKEERLSIMIKEDGAEDYIKSSSKEIPKGDYTLNEEKSYCKNNGKIVSYDNTLGKVSFAFTGTDRCYLYFDFDNSPKAKDIILLNNSGETAIKAKGNPDFTQSATTNEGMYAMEDDLGTSYYFRGAVDNNWVKFGKDLSGNDIYWRIIRINGDGSIRMIYTGITAPTESTKVVMTGTGTQIGTSTFNENIDKAEYVGYMYTVGEQHGLSTDSSIKTYVDNWYATTTLETDASTKALVTDEIYCNDRSASTSYNGTYGEISSWSSTPSDDIYYGDYGRIFGNSSNPSPSLKCTTASDKFTVNSSNGNGALTYPVGLITADEVNIAGGVNVKKNNNYYLFTKQACWISSPSSFADAISFAVNDNHYLAGTTVDQYLGVRPVISISKDAKLSGDGTYNNVYTVS